MFYPGPTGKLAAADVSDGTNAVVLSTFPNFDDINGIVVHENHASAAAPGWGLLTFDVSQPSNPVYVGRYATGGADLDVAMSGSIAYIANSTNAAGLIRVDMTNPAEPFGLTSLTPGGSVSSVDALSNHLYVACGSSGLTIFSVTNPYSPVEKGFRITTTPAKIVRAMGTFAYVACDGGRLEIINVANSLSPVLSGTYFSPGVIGGLDVTPGFAVVVNTNGAVILVNVSNPASPFPVVTNTISGGASGVRVVGDKAYVRTLAGNLVIVSLPGLSSAAPKIEQSVSAVVSVAGETAAMSIIVSGTPPLSYQWSRNGVALTNDARISGVTNSVLQIAGSLLSDSAVYSVAVTNTLGSVTSSNTLAVVNAGTPVLRGGFDPGGGQTMAIDSMNSVLYIATGTFGLEVWDALNPRDPRRLNGTDLAGFCQGIRVFGDFVFIGTGTNGLQTVIATNLFVPVTTIGTNNTPGNSRGLDITGSRGYLADGANGLVVFDASNPFNPSTLGSFDTPGNANDVQVIGELAYVADGSSGLRVLSITNPAAITAVGSYDTAGDARNIKILGSNAFIADGVGGLVVLSITNPALPVLLGNYTAGGPVWDVEAVAQFAFLARGTNGVETLNITNLAGVVSLGVVSNITTADALELEGETLFVSAGTNGVKILELMGVSPAPPAITNTLANQLTLQGTSVTFHFGATGEPALHYQWYKDGQALFDSPNVIGSTSGTLTLSNLQVSGSGDYTLKVRDGWNLADEATVNLVVVPFGTPVNISSFFDNRDALSTHVVGQTAFVASRTNGLQAVDCRNPLAPVRIGQHATLSLAQDVKVRGRYAYVASWSAGLEIFDVFDPTNMVRVGTCDTPGLARSVHLSGNRAYVADSSGGLRAIDVTDPARPFLLGGASTIGQAFGIQSSGSAAYIASAEGGLEIFDSSDALAMYRLGRFDTTGTAQNITVVSNRAYVSDHNGGLRIVDVTMPTAPVQVGAYQTEGDLFGVQVVSNLAYLAEGIGRVEVIDLTSIESPVSVLKSVAGESVQAVQVIGNNAYLADRISGLVVSELYGFSAQAPQIIEPPASVTAVAGRELTLSVASEGRPPLVYQWFRNGVPLTNNAQLAGISGPNLRIQNINATNAGNYSVSVTSPYGSVTSAPAVVTIASFGSPVSRGVFDTPGNASAAAVMGGFAFVADGASGVRLVNVSNPDLPSGAGSYSPTGSVINAWTETNLLFLALGTAGLEIVTATNPASLVRLGGYDTPGDARAVQVVNGNAFVADGGSGLQIISVTNPSAPTLRGSVTTSNFANDVRVSGSFAYVAVGNSGVQVFNVTNPAVPVPVGIYDTPGSATAVRVSGNRAYVADGPGGLLVLDVQNPAAPVALATNLPGGFASGLEVVSNLVVMALGTNGLVVLDVSSLTNITLVGGSAPGGVISSVSVVGGMAFFSAGTNGLRIVELTAVPPLSPTVLTQPANQTVALGGTAQFRAMASGSVPLTHRWYHGEQPVFDDGRIAGAATTQLTISNVQITDSGSYTLRLLNTAGVTSSVPAQLTFVGTLQTQINAATNGAVLELASQVYQETLVLDKNITLSGPWWNRPVLDGVDAGIVLRVLPGASVTLRGIELRNGVNEGGIGGAVLNQGNLTLDRCLIADSVAANGAGIANLQALKISRSIISNNTAIALGGGIYNAIGASLDITNSTVTENWALGGGGVWNAGNFFATNCLVSSNLAAGAGIGGGSGGGLRASNGVMRLVNSTVSGNDAIAFSNSTDAGSGGGVRADAGSVELRSATIAFNYASLQGGGVSAAAGTTVLVRNTLLASNEIAGAFVDFKGTLNSEGFNLLTTTSGAVITGNSIGNRLNLDAGIAPLGDFGGPTLTHALLFDSPAIDAGTNSFPAFDERGVPRPFQIDRVPDVVNGTDIGAVEYVSVVPWMTVSNRTSTSFTLVWSGDSILQKAVTAGGAYVDQTNKSPFTVATHTGLASYFRLRTNSVPPLLVTNGQTVSNIVLTWNGVGLLEHAPTPNGPWEFLGGANPFTVTFEPGAAEFFRLRVLNQ